MINVVPLYRSSSGNSNTPTTNSTLNLEVETVSRHYGPRINLIATKSNVPGEQCILSMDEKQALDLIQKLAKGLEALQAELVDKWMTY